MSGMVLKLLGAAPAGLASRPLLLLGPAGSGRSALLFRAALVGAAASHARVLFLAPRPLERLPGGGATATGAIQRIHFLYPPTQRDLFQLVASLHETSSGTPSLIVLDGLEEYLDRCPGPHVAAQLVALLLDTANYFSHKLNTEPAGCQLLVSMRFPGEAGEKTEQLSAIERYFSAQCWLHPDAERSGGSDSKLVIAHLSQPGTADQEWLVRFDPQGDMKISPLLRKCENDHGSALENDSAEDHPIVPGAHS
ncbi:ATPase SWSAP1 [Tiliqua scincoides]|uniref:ATPase SWSAP1 n=1 Tax=Tiliqua scincoides TaxID=71010 RepID=UPI003461B61C